MKVLLNSESLSPPLTGIGNYSYHLLQELIRIPQVDAVECSSTSRFSSVQQPLLDCDAALTQPLGPTSNSLRSRVSSLALAYQLREILRNGQL
ncbi:MAG: hypothetical protein ACOH2R_22165 [Pseudomonas sp.]